MMARAGATRLVLLTKKYAFKLPNPSGWKSFLWGLLSNLQEADLGRRGWEELCPVLFSLPGGFLVVMPRAEVCSEATMPDEETLRKLTSQPDRCVPAEWKADSWGYLEGRLVAIDFG